MNIIIIIFVGIFFLCFLALIEYVKRRFQIHAEYARKFAHVVGGIFVLVSSNSLKKNEYLALTIFFLFLFTYTCRKKILHTFSEISRKSFGEVTYIMGLIIIGFLFFEDKQIFYPAILILIFPDASAGLIGRKFKKDKKTLIGSLVYFIVATVILMQFFNYSFAVPAAIILTVTEFLSPWGIDNVTVPLMFSFMVKTLL